MNWYLKVLQQYADFSGRARRKEYWMFTLFNIIFFYALLFILGAIAEATGIIWVIFIAYIYSFAMLIPNLAVIVRRLHDIGKSGAYFFVLFIPIAGFIWLLVLLCMEGEARANQWGEDPKGVGNDRMISQIGKE
ncbi:DUF805 domain-containing protein [Polaribacter porphyrae]|uniref:DUF805 domain-containing protein n=1 Tax=Polaribacter porphyrae TaxID=1137780 RepID=A0A2S7WM38_9FLAO|nr:DUF805 domain-containing protein [Polaribacter porphyrae]PQJ78351.1 hypothetical protein BTO18_03720 [Polaribacter porphyrae]